MQKQIISTLLRVEGQSTGDVGELSKNQPSVGPHISMSFTYKVVNRVDVLSSSRRNPVNSPVSSLSASLFLCFFSGRHTRNYTHKHPCITLWVRRGDMLLNFSNHQESRLLWVLDVLALSLITSLWCSTLLQRPPGAGFGWKYLAEEVSEQKRVDQKVKEWLLHYAASSHKGVRFWSACWSLLFLLWYLLVSLVPTSV